MQDTDFQFLMENSADIICRASLDMVLRYVSPSSEFVLGWKPEEMVGTGPNDLVYAEDLPIVAAAHAHTKNPLETGVPITVRMRKKDGSLAWMENRARYVRDETTGEVTEVVLVMRDISERKKLEEVLKVQALTDGLTGLANRRAFDAGLEREWKRAVRDKSQLSLLLLDIDHFKQFNDLNGHLAGDDCLRSVANAVLGCVYRPFDVVARYGGEEIAVILPATEAIGAAAVGRRIMAAIAALGIRYEPEDKGGHTVTASIGVATSIILPGGAPLETPERLFLAADNALYQAKEEGRNRMVTATIVTAPYGPVPDTAKA